MRTRVKICCISSVAEMHAAVAAGADAIGLVSAMPSGPGVIGEDLIAAIAAAAPPALGTFLLTSEVEPAAIAAQQRRCGVNTIQLCDALDASAYPTLREALPGIALVQVIHVQSESAIAEALGMASMVDGLLLDSGNPNAPVKELGGTGRVHDWALSRRIVTEASCPVFLAGGLNPDNVAEAIRHVGPYGVDLCTGVRTDGALDAAKLAAYMGAVATAGAGR
ncbi:MAG: phosphoribosylanthranilate isomerase [Rhodospirillaceae bacterium]|nr:phosphoribosylanthranilate isomerase [Rhodospirillaceae bacterium]